MKINKKYRTDKKGNLALGLIVVLFLSSCSNRGIEVEDNDWARNNLKGKVQSFKEYSYKAKEHFGNIEKVEQERSTALSIIYFTSHIGNVYAEGIRPRT